MHTRIMTMIRASLVHFVLIGATLYGLYGFFAQAPDETPDPTITADEITWLETNWQQRYWNCRVFREGKRKGRCPYKLLGVKLPTADWWQLLQMDPQEFTQQLSTQEVGL